MYYLDNAATTQPSFAVVQAVQKGMTELFGNPSSLHRLGFEAEQAVEAARQAVSELFGCDRSCVFFTSGGTEANNTVLFGAPKAYPHRGKRVVISAIEHASVYEAAGELEKNGYQVIRLLPDSQGRISSQQLLEAVTPDTVLVSCMLVNNELGTVLPILDAASRIKKKNPQTLIHCDAVQAYGKMPLRMNRYPIDFCTSTAHKIHGPKGVGALMVAKGVRVSPLHCGGNQQKKLRPGTEPSPLILGFGVACQEAKADMAAAYQHVSSLHRYLREEIAKMPDVEWLSPSDALPYVASLRVSTIRSETLMHFLEERQVYVSSGSACSKGRPSHVLEAIGLSRKKADSVVRISFSKENVERDVEMLLEGLREALRRLARQ
mgnify:CR=1 FL=1